MRKYGFYWVKQLNEPHFEVAWWDEFNKCFYLTGHWDGFNESAFVEIDERVILRYINKITQP